MLTAPPDDTPHNVTAKVMVFHGCDDPYAPPEDLVALGRKFSGRRAWTSLESFLDESFGQPGTVG